MVKRRKMLIGMGSLAAGAAAATGTGAFTTATVNDRTVTAEVDADDAATVGFVANDDVEGIKQTEEGKIELDLTGTGGEGVNLDSVYSWGSVDADGTLGSHFGEGDEYAFKIVNNSPDDLRWIMEYHFDDISWLQSNRQQKSFIKFQAFKSNGEPAKTAKGSNVAREYPSQNSGQSKDAGLGQRNYNTDLKSGEEMYIVVSIDTTNAKASTDDKLAGKATFRFESNGQLNNPKWNDGW